MGPGVLWYVIHSHYRYVEKFLFNARIEAKNRKLVQFTYSRVIKADKKQKLKLKTSNA